MMTRRGGYSRDGLVGYGGIVEEGRRDNEVDMEQLKWYKLEVQAVL
jgi:hypothetical protein